ncbi:MAG TPA: MFS transporter [Actinopolymorphaceae bacterium]
MHRLSRNPRQRLSEGALSDPDFRRFWASQAGFQLGGQVTLLAIPLLAAIVLEATPFQMGVLRAAESMPILFLGFVAGAFVDRVRRRTVLVGAAIGQAALLLLIPVAALFDAVSIGLLLGIALGIGILAVFSDIAYQSYVPTLVGRHHLVDANSKITVTASGASIVGPGLAGTLVNLVGAPVAILVDIVLRVTGIGLLLSIRRQEHVRPPEERGHLLKDIADGLRLVGSNPVLRAIAGSTAIGNLFGNVITAVLVLYLARDMDLGAGVIGLIFAAANVGFLLAAAGARRIADRLGVGATLIGGAVAAAVGAFLLPAALGPLWLALPLLVLGQAINAGGRTVFTITQLSLRQSITPDDMQGRVAATMRVAVVGTIPLGALLGGVLGEAIGLWPAIAIGAIGHLLPLVWLWSSPVRTYRLPDEAVECA